MRSDSVSSFIPVGDSSIIDSIELVNAPTITGQISEALSISNNNESLLLPVTFEGWYIYYFLLLFAGYAVARSFLGSLSRSTFMAAFRYNTAVSMFNDNSQLQRQRDNVLYGFYFLSVSFFGMLFMEHMEAFPFQLTGYKLLIFNNLVIVFYFFVRIGLVRAIGHQFVIKPVIREYLYHGFSYNKLLGMLFVPLNVMIAYSEGILYDVIFWIAGILLVIILMVRIYRMFSFSMKHHLFSFYLFLYLCALEIAPLLFAIKWFTIIV